MFRRNDNNLYKLLAERYYDEEFCSSNFKDYPGYKDINRQIIDTENRIMTKYPDAMDDLYGKIN